MQGLAKTSEQAQTQPVVTKTSEAIGVDTKPSIHLELYRYFNINPIEPGDTNQIAKINGWVLEKGSLGKGLKELRSLENKLGAPSVGETRVSKLYNYLRMSDSIKSLRVEEDLELMKIGDKAKIDINTLRSNFNEKKAKYDEEIKRAERDYLLASKRYRLEATNRARAIKAQYRDRLEELRSMRSAFAGGK